MGNLVRLVDDLLDVARISRGKVDLRKRDIDMTVVLRDALMAVSSVIEAREHTLDVNVDEGPFRMHADATRVEQIIVNLLTNASKYTEPGGKLAGAALARGPRMAPSMRCCACVTTAEASPRRC
jgi:signal transduction histidine kinase